MTLRYLIRGRVQGVGYRYFVVRQAGSLGLTGWVRNLPDGRVEVVAAGQPSALADLEGHLRGGPPHAQVDSVDIAEISDDMTSLKMFDVRK